MCERKDSKGNRLLLSVYTVLTVHINCSVLQPPKKIRERNTAGKPINVRFIFSTSAVQVTAVANTFQEAKIQALTPCREEKNLIGIYQTDKEMRDQSPKATLTISK